MSLGPPPLSWAPALRDRVDELALKASGSASTRRRACDAFRRNMPNPYDVFRFPTRGLVSIFANVASSARQRKAESSVANSPRNLSIRFHGRVIEHLGIEMYQSPVAAIAELLSNAWDAEASRVDVSLPEAMNDDAEILIEDDGDGMTFEECQERFLKVGYNRRKATGTDRTRTNRPVMGRKGIGKFAGFGIAELLVIETISRDTGELTEFALDVNRLLEGGDESDYADNAPMDVDVIRYLKPDDTRIKDHGTSVYLRSLTFKNTPSTAVFRKGMARRFLLLDRAGSFKISINGEELPDSFDDTSVEYDFPRDLADDNKIEGLARDGAWGTEEVAPGQIIRWRIQFFRTPISEADFSGVAVYAHHKLAQRPFTFDLGGGIGAQQGLPYVSGVVEADYIDEMPHDLISTERQRINWTHDAAKPLHRWGQERLQMLLREWQKRRSADKVKSIKDRLASFSDRLQRLPNNERKVVTRALEALARISTLTTEQFDDLSSAILTAWEGGRLRDLISELADAHELDASELVGLLAESRVMTALHAAERVKTQLNLILSLEERLTEKELENAVRDFIAENPWLVRPDWETFRKEIGVDHLVREAADESGLDRDESWSARVDLVLASGDVLLVLEFMRPGLTLNWDHLSRYERYVLVLRDKIQANAGGSFRSVRGMLVADHIERKSAMTEKIASLRAADMGVEDWGTLLRHARAQWVEYFDILVDRAPEDERMTVLVELEKEIPRD